MSFQVNDTFGTIVNLPGIADDSSDIPVQTVQSLLKIPKEHLRYHLRTIDTFSYIRGAYNFYADGVRSVARQLPIFGICAGSALGMAFATKMFCDFARQELRKPERNWLLIAACGVNALASGYFSLMTTAQTIEYLFSDFASEQSRSSVSDSDRLLLLPRYMDVNNTCYRLP